MYVQKLDPDRLVNAYNVDLQMLYPVDGVVEPPFGAAWAILAPGEATKHHQHQELETFFIVRGEGEMTVDDETVTVSQGSVVFHRPFHHHTLRNTSADQDLLFLTVWWEDRAQWIGEQAEPAAGPSRVLVTAAPPTPNGDLHLGHLAGPYLSADYHARYLRQRGVTAHYACGSDDHCMYVERQGASMGMSGEAAADHFVARIEESLAAADVRMDVFMHPRSSPYFEPRVLDFFHRLWTRDRIELREAPAPFCGACERYLFEADIAGGCPHCGEGVTGNTCEACGRINDCIGLLEPRCTACGAVPETRPATRLIFPLGGYGERIARYHRSVTMNAHLRAFCERAVADGLPDVAISHPSGWGIPVPTAAGGDPALPDHPALADQTLYVWFEMAARYFAYVEHVDEGAGFDGVWRTASAEIVQFFGFDNSFYYAILLPALYLAYDPEIELPSAFVTNELYCLEGQKFSTSRDHRILARDMAAAVPSDVMRYFLAHTCPEREETDFTQAAFEDLVDRRLRRLWRPWLAELCARVTEEHDGEVPATGDWTAEQRHVFDRLRGLIADAEESLAPATFSPQRLARTLDEVVRTARRFAAGEAHWRGVPGREQERRTSIALELLAAKVLAMISAPVMPGFAGRLWQALGLGASIADGSWESAPTWLPAGQRIGDLAACLELPAKDRLLVLRPTRSAA